MSQYLPVLLVSVTGNSALNAVPDDSSLETLPSGQVDYLSHEWLEEDVWRSWRNMTRQKNEIANGVRLENASWRTWWKQRNKLRTISPETLNWLKDSDVTWLYGPLHTGVGWTPPPKPKSDPTSVDKTVPNSVHDRLGLATTSPLHSRPPSTASERSGSSRADIRNGKRKPILKHRSISQLLTSDFPPNISSRLGTATRDNIDGCSEDLAPSPKRPGLPRTRSDNFVAKWRSSDDTFAAFGALQPDTTPCLDLASSSNPSQEPAVHQSPVTIESPSISPHSTSSNVPGSQVEHSHGPGCVHSKKKHIAFNTFVEQCIALDKPKTVKSGHSHSLKLEKARAKAGLDVYETKGKWNGKTKGLRWHGNPDDEEEEDSDDHSSGYEDDSESSSSSEEQPSYPYSESDDVEFLYENVFEDDDEDGEDSLSQLPSDDRLSRPMLPNTQSQSFRSHSQASTSSSSSVSTNTSLSSNDSCTTTDTSPSPARNDECPAPPLPRSRRRSRRSVPDNILLPRHRLSNSSQSSNATIVMRRKSLSAAMSRRSRRSSKAQSSPVTHVSIAPIPPTRLKTVEVENEWDSFGSGYGYHHANHHSIPESWVDGFGDEGYSDDGGPGRWYGDMTGSLGVEQHRGSGEAVELVYVPLGSGYDGLSRKYSKSRRRYRNNTSSGTPDSGNDGLDLVYSHHESFFREAGGASMPVPIVIRTPPAIGQYAADEDAYDYFAGPDLGEEFIGGSKKGRRTPDSWNNEPESHPVPESNPIPPPQDDSPPRGRSRSRSRTPSPAVLSSPTLPSSAPSIPISSAPSRTLSDPSLSSTHLSPPARGRSGIQQDTIQPRGRSSTRTSSSSLSDRERSSHSSSLSSLSPDGVVVASTAYGAFGSRGGQREPRRRDRQRDRAERRLTHSLSPESLATSGITADMPLSISQPNRPVLMDPPSTAFELHSQPDNEKDIDPTPTPANTPVVGMSSNSSPKRHPSPPREHRSGKERTQLSSPTQLSISLSASPVLSSSTILPPSPQSKGDLDPVSLLQANVIPTGSGPNDSLVGLAVGMVSSAGAYLGLWNSDVHA